MYAFLPPIIYDAFNLIATSCQLWFPLIQLIMHYYKMWVQFTSPCSLDQWIHCFFIGLRSLQPVNSFKIQWNHLVYKDTFCCSFATRLPLHKYYFSIILQLLFNLFIINIPLHCNSQHHVALQTYQTIEFIKGESSLLKWNYKFMYTNSIN
jgi:hypothetical protein